MFQVDEKTTPSGIGRPRRLDDSQEFVLGDDLLVYPSHGQALIAINSFGRAVWERCDGKETIFEIGRQLNAVSRNGSQNGSAQNYLNVEAAVMHFFKEGLVVFDADDDAPATVLLESLESIESLESRAETECLRIDHEGSQIWVTSPVVEVLEHVRKRFEPMLAAGGEESIGQFEVRLNRGEYVLLKNGEGVREDLRLVDSLYYLEGEIVQAFMASHSELTWFHAGAASCRDQAILVIGGAGAGKSTIVGGLCDSRWSYLSDEVAPVDVAAGEVVPFPLSPLVREAAESNLAAQGFRKLRKLEQKLAPSAVCRRSVGIRGLVFPQFDHDTPSELTLCSPAEAALSLVESCHSFADCGERAIQAIAVLVERFPAYRLSFRSRESAVELLISELGE